MKYDKKMRPLNLKVEANRPMPSSSMQISWIMIKQQLGYAIGNVVYRDYI
ncbi:MAG: hypothetical protein IPL23_02595 [Saprospiraceae bacterium]|nr:hypothetical protein [Saprospiraceae bacterium]